MDDQRNRWIRIDRELVSEMDRLEKEIQKFREIAKHANLMLDEYLYNRIHKMMKNEVFIKMARDTSLLIISDYLNNTASALQDYFEQHSDVRVLGAVADIEEAMAIAEKNVIDLFVIIDILHNHSSYNKINELKKVNPLQMSIIFANIDDVVEDHCAEYKINKRIDIRTPVDELLMEVRIMSIIQSFQSKSNAM